MYSNMKRWSDEKLDKELAFAIAAKDPNDSATIEWLRRLQLEADNRRRQRIRERLATLPWLRDQIEEGGPL